jgi:predicted N-acyltransferase
LFVEEELKSEFLELGYFHQKTIQYHFFNHFDSFDDFMNSLKMRKRKQIKKERAAVSSSLLHIKKVCCADLTADELDQVYQLYLSTIEKKHSLAYLNKNFFYQLQNLMSEHVFFFMAYEQETLIAMSMFIETDSTLFGRYWGIFPEYEKQYSFLHFELCYYRGIEYCIDCKLEKFEAGAQGEQKLLRGFKPVMIHSFHHIKNVELSKVIENHVHSMNHKVELEVERLAEYLPYKKDSEIS